MKKVISTLLILFSFIVLVILTLNTIDNYYSFKIKEVGYNNTIGTLYGNTIKEQGLMLKKLSLSQNDNYLIFGSSELGSMVKPFHPDYFFANKKTEFQVNIIGRGYSQSLIHSIDLAALSNELKGKKIVIIISPQWFTKEGLTQNTFNMNFSPLQFYTAMFNNNLNSLVKLDLCKRVYSLGSGGTLQVRVFSFLYSNNTLVSKSILTLLMPYYNLQNKILSIKDKIQTYKFIKQYGKQKQINLVATTIDWDKERSKAVIQGKQESNNNDFQMENGYYNRYIKDNLKNLKGSLESGSYLQSSEYGDLKLLMDICKTADIKPIFVSVPMNGKWYDYAEFSKEDRQKYYQKVNKLITSNGFQVADFSKNEYDKYFLKDAMHLGWQGWIDVDEAIDEYYHSY